MSSNLYLEAIEAAEQLKNSAEEKVKQRLIESMSPQIKMLVEKKLMEDESDEKQEEITDESDAEEYGTEAQDECGSSYESVNEVTLDEDSRRILNKFISEKAKKDAMHEKIESLKEAIKTLKKAYILSESTKTTGRNKRKINLLFKNIVSEIKNIKSNSIIKKDKTILKEYYNLLKELNNMSTRRNRKQRYLDESLEDLLEMNLFEADEDDDEDMDADAPKSPESEEGDEDLMSGLDLDDKDSDEGDSDDDMPELDSDEDAAVSPDTTVQDLARMAGLMDSDEEGSDDELELEGFFESDMSEEDDLEDGMHELDELDAEMSYEMHAGADEDVDEIEEMMESRRGDRVLEIDENMLRREIGRMKAIREGEAKDMASHFGGGSLEGEAFVDGVELNKLHEMRNKAAKVVRKNRMLESKLAQYKKALRGMKGQLQEMNLFNAKLLYANKLMQNRDLSIKQQRHVVESLDEAKTLGEAKILFESLSKSLVSSRSRSSSNLNESTRRTLNASSAPVRSAQTRNESVALDRWATLAGIKK